MVAGFRPTPGTNYSTSVRVRSVLLSVFRHPGLRLNVHYAGPLRDSGQLHRRHLYVLQVWVTCIYYNNTEHVEVEKHF